MSKKKSRKKIATAAKRRAPERARARHPLSPRVLLLLAAIILVGLVLRGMYLRELTNAPDFQFPLVDADYHDYWARGMASGHWPAPRFEPNPGIQEFPYFRSPGYPFFLAAIYKVTGTGYLAPRVVQMLVGLVNALLGFLIARRLLDLSCIAFIAAAERS